jgi:hypothetical protein
MAIATIPRADSVNGANLLPAATAAISDCRLIEPNLPVVTPVETPAPYVRLTWGAWNSKSGRRLSPCQAQIECDKETNHVNRQHRSLAGLAATLLLAGLATVACARGGAGTGQPGGAVASTPSAAITAQPAIDTSAAGATVTDAAPVPTDSPNGSAAVGGSTGGGGTAAATDPIGTDLQKLNQLLQGVQDSLSGAGGGGE